MSKLFVDEIVHASSQGSGTITLGASGETVSFASGVTGLNYPAFEAYVSAGQGLSDNVTTKINFDGVNFDTDSCYDNTTNYRFTPTVAGKYFVYTELTLTSDTNTDVVSTIVNIYKNGSVIKLISEIFSGSYIRRNNPTVTKIVDMNGTTDYLEVFANINVASGTPSLINFNNSNVFGAYRIGT
jgi:hypothetical protein